VLATFGPPAQTYHFGIYTVLIWHKNLLSELPPPRLGTGSLRLRNNGQSRRIP
jgi:hypothetical protein